jgi:outer membrane protein OmpA-like peptidoglycan-associated protein
MKYIILLFLFVSCQKVAVKPINEAYFDENSIQIFLRVLNVEYAKVSQNLSKEDAKAFLVKSKLSLERDARYYNENTFKLSQKRQDEAQIARLFLEKLRGNIEMFDAFPESIARMQVYYDCMLVEFRDENLGISSGSFCTKRFDTLQKGFQRSGFTRNLKYENEKRETTIIYFNSGSAKIGEEFQKPLYEITQKAKKLKDYSIKIIGLTDKAGTLSKNIQLSKQRAENTKEMLVKMGLPSAKITTEYYAEEFALIQTEKGEKLNRRVLIDLIIKE